LNGNIRIVNREGVWRKDNKHTDSSIIDSLSNLGAEGLGEADVALLKDTVEDLKGASVTVEIGIGSLGGAWFTYNRV